MTAQQFRERFRAYGVLVPIGDVPAHLACGWRLLDDAEELALHGDFVLLRAPRAEVEPCAA